MNEVPYEQIDCEIRKLVRLINEFEGLRTIGSCAGHTSPSPEGGVSFTVDTQEHLAALLSALPPTGWQGGFIANLAQWSALWISLHVLKGQLSYTLHIDGYPQHVQRALVGRVEKALEEALTPLRQGTHPSCPTYAAGRTQDTERRYSPPS